MVLEHTVFYVTIDRWTKLFLTIEKFPESGTDRIACSTASFICEGQFIGEKIGSLSHMEVF